MLLGQTVPTFVCASQLGPIEFPSAFSGNWIVIVSLPADFTPVCTTELSMLAVMKPEFERRQCNIVGLAVDKPESHAKWIEDVSKMESVSITFPVLADESGDIARSFGFIHPLAEGTEKGKFTIRGVHIIDPDRVVQLSLMYPTTTGRNFNEIVRCLDALQLARRHKVGTPANWQVGEDVVILPSVDDVEAEELFPKGFHALKPYLRITPQPDSTS